MWFMKDGFRPIDMYVVTPTRELRHLLKAELSEVDDVRGEFTNYSVSPTSSLPWRMTKI